MPAHCGPNVCGLMSHDRITNFYNKHPIGLSMQFQMDLKNFSCTNQTSLEQTKLYFLVSQTKLYFLVSQKYRSATWRIFKLLGHWPNIVQGRRNLYSTDIFNLRRQPKHCGVWRRFGRVDAFRPKGNGFNSCSSPHVGTLGKSFTHSCLWHFGVKFWHSIRAVSGAPLSSSGLEEAL